MKLALLMAAFALATLVYAAVYGDFDFNPFAGRERAPIEDSSQER